MDLQQPTLCLQIVLLVERVTLMLVTGNLESDDIYFVPLWRHLAQISELVTIWHFEDGGLRARHQQDSAAAYELITGSDLRHLWIRTDGCDIQTLSSSATLSRSDWSMSQSGRVT